MLLCNLFAPLLIYCLSAPNASFCVLHENGPAPFLQLVPCFASSVEGAREPSQEERVLLLLRALGQACSAQQPAAPGGQKLPPPRPTPTPTPGERSLGHILSWMPPMSHFPWTAPQAPQRMDLGQVAPARHTAAFFVTQWAKAAPSPTRSILQPWEEGRWHWGFPQILDLSLQICYSHRVLFTSC